MPATVKQIILTAVVATCLIVPAIHPMLPDAHGWHVFVFVLVSMFSTQIAWLQNVRRGAVVALIGLPTQAFAQLQNPVMFPLHYMKDPVWARMQEMQDTGRGCEYPPCGWEMPQVDRDNANTDNSESPFESSYGAQLRRLAQNRAERAGQYGPPPLQGVSSVANTVIAWLWQPVSSGFISKEVALCLVLVLVYLFVAKIRKLKLRSIILARYRIMGQSTIRDTFIASPIAKSKLKRGHSHAYSSAARNDARDHMIKFSRLIGREPFFYQASRSVQDAGYRNCREYIWSDDLKTAFRDETATRDEVRCIVDVAYYLDMNEILGSTPATTLVYTLAPEAACESNGDYAFTFNENQEVEVNVSGGARYVHKLVNYGHDCVTTFGRDGTTVYLVERQAVVKHRVLVLLTPIAHIPNHRFCGLSFGSLLSWIFLSTVSHTRLDYFTPVKEGWIRFDVMSELGMRRTTAKTGSFCCATVSTQDDDTVGTAARIGTTKLSQSTVKSIVKDMESTAAYTLAEFYRDRTPWRVPTVFSLKQSTFSYQPTGPKMDPDAQPLVKPFMTPLLRAACVPTLSESAVQYALSERITKVADKTQTTAFTGRLMAEFVEHLIPEPYQASPVSEDFVREKQARPAQKTILDRAVNLGPHFKNRIQAFPKKETATKFGPLRLISPVGDKLKLDLSKFSYVLTEHLKGVNAYAFGKTPPEIAAAVASVCASAESVLTTDFSKMDGHTAPACRDLERMVLLRLFSREYHEELVELHNKTVGQKAYLPFDISYNTGFARCSGEPPTSAFSTIINLFIIYCAYRNSGMQSKLAWKSTMEGSIAGGDDGIVRNLSAEVITKAAERVGQVLTSDSFSRGDPGVNFLSRFYGPGVWYGDVNSMCDLKRQLAKFHTSHNLPVTIHPSVKLKEKCLSFVRTDANTPIIGQFCKDALVALMREGVDVTSGKHNKYGLRTYWSLKETNFPNEFGDWMNDLAMEQLPGLDFKVIAESKLVTVEDFLTRTPVVAHVEIAPPKVDMVVDGVVVEAKTKTPDTTKEDVVRPNEDKRATVQKRRKPDHKYAKITKTGAGRGKPTAKTRPKPQQTDKRKTTRKLDSAAKRPGTPFISRTHPSALFVAAGLG